MPRTTWLPRIPPLLNIIIIATVGVVLVVAAALYSMQTPWLGLQFEKPQEFHHLKVQSVFHEGPSEGLLKPGDRIVGILDAQQRWTNIETYTLVDEPNMLPDYDTYNHFFEHQGRLWKALNDLRLTVILDVGKEVVVYPWVSRPLSAIPLSFWLINFFGLSVLVMSTTVWSFERGELPARILVVAGGGYFIGALAASIYVSRELSLQPEQFFILAALNDLGIMILGYSLVSLLWYYPTQLGKFPLARIIYPVIIIGWIFGVMQMPALIHSFHKYIVVYILLILFGIRQWQQTSHAPIERAALKWQLMTLVITIGLTIILFYGPILVTGEPIASITIPFALVFILFLGISLGVLKYQLFNLEKWWFEAWFWLLGGFMVLLVDATLVYLLDLHNAPALGLAVVLVGWLYFPIRQWILDYFVTSTRRNPEHYLPVLIESLFSKPAMTGAREQFTALLRKVFEPSGVNETTEVLKDSEINRNGLVLRLPCLEGDGTIELLSRNHGKRLFSPDDIKLAETLRTMALKAVTMRQAEEEGARIERARIMRDLHDDVAARLLSLVHRAPDEQQAEQARSALKALRETIYSLDDTTQIEFDELFSDLGAEIREWLPEEIRLVWDAPSDAGAYPMLPRQQINIRRIVQEALHNAVRHAEPTMVEVRTWIEENEPSWCHITICNDGNVTPTDGWVAGKGLNNITTRAKELRGMSDWSVNDAGLCCVTIKFPLQSGEGAVL